MYRGEANWEEIAKVKSKLRSIPLIGNGDIKTVEDAMFRIRNYPVDGIMIGRGGIAKPWLFRQIAETLQGKRTEAEPSGQQIAEMIRLHFAMLKGQFNEQTALTMIAKTICHYAAGKSGARRFRNDICTAKDTTTFFKTVQDFFG